MAMPVQQGLEVANRDAEGGLRVRSWMDTRYNKMYINKALQPATKKLWLL